MPDPLVSVIIPCFNQAAFLRETIDSALAQTYCNREVIVVDDGSCDETPSILAAYGSSIVAIRQPNRGLARTRIRAVAASLGSLIALLDGDDRWLPRKLELEVPRFADPAVALVHGAYRKIPASHPRAGEVSKRDGAETGFHRLLRENVVGAPSSAIFRRDVFDALGGFDAELPFGAEDWDLWIRIAAIRRVVASSAITMEYRLHKGSMTEDYERTYTSMMEVLRKHGGDHPHCADCRDAIRFRSRRLRSWYFDHATRDAVRKRQAGDRLGAMMLRLQAVGKDPRALRRLFPYLVRRISPPLRHA